MCSVKRTFDELVAEAESVSVDGWDFSWLNGRATEQRPSWGYQRLLRARLTQVTSALDIYTGGGEVLAGAGPFPPTMAATESWPPNLELATRLLHPLGVVVVAAGKEPPLPFGDSAFELVSGRHPSAVWWDDIARVLKPGGTYLAQHIGVIFFRNLIEHFLGSGPRKLIPAQMDPESVAAETAQAKLDVVDVRQERIQLEFFDVGAVIYFLRKVIWIVPGFAVAEYRDKLLHIHQQIEADGSFVTHSSRVLIEARKPG
jgi:SAM-dependent methyltransferase